MPEKKSMPADDKLYVKALSYGSLNLQMRRVIQQERIRVLAIRDLHVNSDAGIAAVKTLCWYSPMDDQHKESFGYVNWDITTKAFGHMATPRLTGNLCGQVDLPVSEDSVNIIRRMYTSTRYFYVDSKPNPVSFSDYAAVICSSQVVLSSQVSRLLANFHFMGRDGSISFDSIIKIRKTPPGESWCPREGSVHTTDSETGDDMSVSLENFFSDDGWSVLIELNEFVENCFKCGKVKDLISSLCEKISY
jgi:hypothetical protein